MTSVFAVIAIACLFAREGIASSRFFYSSTVFFLVRENVKAFPYRMGMVKKEMLQKQQEMPEWFSGLVLAASRLKVISTKENFLVERHKPLFNKDGSRRFRPRGTRLIEPLQRVYLSPDGELEPLGALGSPPGWFEDSWWRWGQCQEHVRRQTQGLAFEENTTSFNIRTGRVVAKRLVMDDIDNSPNSSGSHASAVGSVVQIAPQAYLQIDASWSMYQLADMIYAARNFVVAKRQKRRAVLCLRSACLHWGVPLFAPPVNTDLWVERTQRIRQTFNKKGDYYCTENFTTERYAYKIDDNEIVNDSGMYVTSLERTLIDVLLFFEDPDWIVSGDDLLRRLCRKESGNGEIDAKTVSRVKERLRRRIQQKGAVGGKRQALYRLNLLNPQSESVGESVMRLLAIEVGLPTLECQFPVIVPVHGRRGWKNSYLFDGGSREQGCKKAYRCASLEKRRQILEGEGEGATALRLLPGVRHYYVDLVDRQLGVALEFDGRAKYQIDYASAAGWKEKKRESEISKYFRLFRRVIWEDLRDWGDFVSQFVPVFQQLRAA